MLLATPILLVFRSYLYQIREPQHESTPAPCSCYTYSVQTAKQADRPLYAIVSEELVGKAGSLVMALSTPLRGPNVGAYLNAMQRAPADSGSGTRSPERFALIELPVEPPVDLVVGGRWAVPSSHPTGQAGYRTFEKKSCEI